MSFQSTQFLNDALKKMIEEMFALRGIDICLTRGTDINDKPYPTTPDLFEEYWKHLSVITNDLDVAVTEYGNEMFKEGHKEARRDLQEWLSGSRNKLGEGS